MTDRDASRPSERYPVPAEVRRAEEVIERSRFVATVGRASTVEDARAFIDRVRDEFPDATHNCWAYVVGPPGDTRRIGMSDAGEPSGTAGRPMLDVLLGSGVGDVAAVVTRYYGGVKLGRGGLVRAYGGAVKLALDGLPLTERVETAELFVGIGYPAITPLKNVLGRFEAVVIEESYGSRVDLRIRLPREHIRAFRETVAALTDGTGSVENAPA
jgi:uncharacterized YigZ family protein